MSGRPITFTLAPLVEQALREEAERYAAERPNQVTTIDDAVAEAVAMWIERRRLRAEVIEVLG